VPGSEKIFGFMEKQGQLWGARHEVISKISFAVSELFEMIVLEKLSKSPVTVHVGFDELKLEASVEYTGQRVQLYEAMPDFEKLETDPEAVNQLSGFLVSKYCDKIKISEKDGQVKIHMFFEH